MTKTRTIHFTRAALVAGTALAGLFATTPVVAQEAGRQEQVAAIDDIIVTARRREESLQDVPIAVTAFTAETLEDRQIESLVDVADLPDEWFRDAWTMKGSNSGLPYVDLEKARPIQWARISSAVARENKRRSLDLFGGPPIRFQRMRFERAIRNARDAEEIKRIWPELLSHPQ